MNTKSREKVPKEQLDNVMDFVKSYIRDNGIPWVPYKEIRKYAKEKMKLTKRQIDGVLGVLENMKKLNDDEIVNIKKTWFYFPVKMIEDYIKSGDNNG